jgi:hypothetical protein
MSINQNANAGALPNFCNLGILLRILVIVDGMSLAASRRQQHIVREFGKIL